MAARRSDTAVHALEADLGLASRPAGGLPAGGELEPCAVRSMDSLDRACVADLAAWLGWLKAARDVQADEQAMRRLALVYAVGWTAVSGAILSVPVGGVVAAVLGVVLFAGMLALGCVVTEPGWRGAAGGVADDAWSKWSSLGPAERARLVRVINLSRMAARPLGARLLLSELDDALAVESLASWPALSELRDIARAGCVGLVPFGSEPSERESPYLFAGHVP